jgi:hypothetical protein
VRALPRGTQETAYSVQSTEDSGENLTGRRLVSCDIRDICVGLALTGSTKQGEVCRCERHGVNTAAD